MEKEAKYCTCERPKAKMDEKDGMVERRICADSACLHIKL
jgi:hypothetical protein